MDPRVAGEMHRPAREPFDDDALKEELLLVAVDHRDRPRLAEGGVHVEFRGVHHALSLHVLLLVPILDHRLAALVRLFGS